MDKNFKKFVNDVQQGYNYTDSYVDSNYNIIATSDGKSLLFSQQDLYSRYSEFRMSALPYREWVTRTIGYITREVKKWLEK